MPDFQGELWVGDCLQLLPQVPAASARLVIADPPYFQVLRETAWDQQWPHESAYLNWCDQWMSQAMRILQPGGLLYCFGQLGKRESAMLHLMAQAGRQYQFHDLIIWDRMVGYNERGDSFTPAYEMILVLRQEGPVYFDKNAVREPYDQATIASYMRDKRYKDQEARQRHLNAGKYATNIWRIPSLKGSSREKAGHPSQKPEKLVERIILSGSQPGELVVDPFLGSGTTAVVAQRHGRRWLGIEQDETYVATARRRLEEIPASLPFTQ